MTESPHQGPTPLAITLSIRISTYEWGGWYEYSNQADIKVRFLKKTKKGRPIIENI